MTMLSFRADDSEASAAQEWASRLGVDRSELLREALHAHLVKLASEVEALRPADPVDDENADLASIADWGPAEEWSDWADSAPGGRPEPHETG